MTLSLVLASSSPFRRMLMENAGLSFEIRPADIDERAIEAGLTGNISPQDVAMELARAKALDVSGRVPGALVLGSDQTMSLGDKLYHKPQDLAEARSHLASLSGRTHRLNSAVALARDGEIVWDHLSCAQMTVRPLSDAFIDGYIEHCGDKLLASVGAYQLEGEGVQLFSEIRGDYFTILGLPLLPLLQALRDLHAIDG